MTFQQQLEFTNETNRFMRRCGIRMTELTQAHSVAELEVTPECWNTGDKVQGGLLYTMADAAVAAYGRAFYDSCVTLDGNFHYLGNVSEGTLVAEAVPVRRGGRVLVMDVTVRAGEQTLATGTFTVYRTGK